VHGSSPQILFPYFFRSPTSAFADLHMNVPLTVHSDLPVSTQLCDMFLCWDVRPANCYGSNGNSTLHTSAGLLRFQLFELCSLRESLLWPPCVADADIIFLPCDFYLLLSFFPRLLSAVGDWMSTILPFHTWCGLSAKL